jgi:hypothetical protein
LLNLKNQTSTCWGYAGATPALTEGKWKLLYSKGLSETKGWCGTMLYAPLGGVPELFIFGTLYVFAIGGTTVVTGLGFAIDGEKALALGLSFDSCK